MKEEREWTSGTAPAKLEAESVPTTASMIHPEKGTTGERRHREAQSLRG